MIKLASALLVTTLLTTPAFAGSASNSGAQSHSSAMTIVNVPGNSASNSSAPSGGGDPTINYTGGYTVRNTPDIAVSSYAGAANSCGVGGSLGISGPGFGIGGSIARESEQCVKREWYKLMEITAEHRAAQGLSSQAADYSQWAAGIACSVSAISAVAPPGYCGHPAAVQVMAAVQQPVRTAPVQRPAWCASARPTTEASREYVEKECQ